MPSDLHLLSNRTRISVTAGSTVLAALLSSSAGSAVTLRVPAEYPTISAAANVAQQGDSILVWRDSDGEYENEQINLRQGVVIRGMESVYPEVNLLIRACVFNLLDAPSVSFEDTTRVEHFYIHSPPFHESVQVFTPQSCISECYFWVNGPQDFTSVRVWRGGVITRNFFGGLSESNGIEIRQGTTIVTKNMFDDLFLPFSLLNVGAQEPASLYFKNNTVRKGYMRFHARADSYVELVNNITVQATIDCVGTQSMRYNDFFQTGSLSCSPLGLGNIAQDPLLCVQPDDPIRWIDADSPCVGAGEDGETMGAGGICGVTSIGPQHAAGERVRLSIDPNPVLTAAEFRFDADLENATLEIFDPSGRMIDRLHPRGRQVRWNPSRTQPSGIYFARLRSAGVSETVKFLLIR